jgi:hypothetical protein
MDRPKPHISIDADGTFRVIALSPFDEDDGEAAKEMVKMIEGERRTMFVVCNSEGNEMSGQWRSLEAAVGDAKDMLEDDPELGELEVWQIDRHEKDGTAVPGHVKTITFGPDAHWDTIVVVLDPGEKPRPPGPVPHRVTEEDLDGYDLGDPKRIALEQVIERGGWA